MHDTSVINPCPVCGTDVGRGNPAYCPNCRSPLLSQREAPPGGSIADPFGDWPDDPSPGTGPVVDHDPFATSSVATKPRRSRRVVWIVAVLGVAAAIRVVPAVWGAISGPERDDSGAVVEGGTASAMDVRAGDCFNLDDEFATSIEEAALMPCAEPHMFEAYATYVYPNKAQDPYPGLDAIFDLSDQYCFDEFETFVGMPWEDSILDFAYLYPEPEGWRSGDRTVVCLLARVDGEQMIGTMEGVRA